MYWFDSPLAYVTVPTPTLTTPHAMPRSAVNFSNPHINIGLPVFTIHGNHDDPAGQDNLSAVDLLSSCGLVNYFGKQVKQKAGGRGQEAGAGGLHMAVMVCFMPEGESIDRMYSTPTSSLVHHVQSQHASTKRPLC